MVREKRNNYRVGDLIRRFSVVKTVDRHSDVMTM